MALDLNREGAGRGAAARLEDCNITLLRISALVIFDSYANGPRVSALPSSINRPVKFSRGS